MGKYNVSTINQHMVIIDQNNTLVVSLKGNFEFEAETKQVVNNRYSIIFTDKEPIFNNENGIKYYPEEQIKK